MADTSLSQIYASIRAVGSFSRLVLLRHGETAWSASGQHTGRTDIPLDDTGRAQARAAAAQFVAEHFDVVLCSPLSRARDTCQLAGLSDDPVLLDDLMEWDYGSYDGVTTATIHESRPEWDLFRDGCPGGEQLSDVVDRAERVLGALDFSSTGTKSAAIVSHGHYLRVLSACALALRADDARHFVLDPAGVAVLGFERSTPVLDAWNR